MDKSVFVMDRLVTNRPGPNKGLMDNSVFVMDRPVTNKGLIDKAEQNKGLMDKAEQNKGLMDKPAFVMSRFQADMLAFV